MNFIFLIITYIIFIIFIIFLSRKFQLIDKPNFRKIHEKKIVNTGGIAIYGYMTFIVITNEISFEIENIIVVGSLISLTGFLDDRIDLTPEIKLIMIVVPSAYLILNGFLLSDLGLYEIIGLIDLGKFGIIFTFLAVGLLINSYNYIDGIDGLLLGINITSLLYLIFLLDDFLIQQLLLNFLIIIAITFLFNLLPEKNYFKIFIGDTGSLFLGFFSSFLLIYMYLYQAVHPAYLIWTCWYPVFDFLYVTFYRIKKGKKVYIADKIHFHHILFQKFNNSQIKTTLVLNTLNILVITLGFLTASYLGKIYSLILFIILFCYFFYLKLSYHKQV